MKRARIQEGSVVLNRHAKIWYFLWREHGERKSKRLGSLSELPTKASAKKAAEPYRRLLVDKPQQTTSAKEATVTVQTLVEHYRKEKMPTRTDTRRSYDVWLRRHILPRFGSCEITDVQARPVELWLAELQLAPKSKAHIRGMLSVLWDYAMWRGDIPTQRNPMELVTVKGATKRVQKPRSLTVTEFQKFAAHLAEPFRSLALLSVSLGLRISEALALKWEDVDWFGSRLRVERAIVCQKVDETKTDESRKQIPISEELLNVLKVLHAKAQFSAPGEWLFASPVQNGTLPWSYDQIWRVYQKAAKAAGIASFGTHTLRHTYRSWLSAVGAAIEVQQKLMRHADIRTTLNIYGEVVTDEMERVNRNVGNLALNGLQGG